jgi:Tfp pilus assembly protein PilV
MVKHKTVVALAFVSGLSPGRFTNDALTTPMDREQQSHTAAKRADGFTLAELVISVGVLVLLVFLATQLLNSAATVTRLGHKQMDADSQARQLLDRMTIDFEQMIKRPDVTYYLKGGAGGTQTGNDQIAFYSATPGYYSTTTSTTQSPLSLIAYRVNPNSSNPTYNKLERLGKGLLWNGVSSTDPPLIFWQAIAAPSDTDYGASGEVIGPGVFRFEYCYLRTDGTVSTTPPNVSQLAAIVVDIAVIDPKSKVLLSDAQIATFATFGNANFLADYSSSMSPGQLRTQWQNTINGITSLPRPALSGIRFYERYFYLSPPTLLTP